MPETQFDTTQGNLEFNKTDMLNVPVSILIADNNSENFKLTFVNNNTMMAVNPFPEKWSIPMSEVFQKMKNIVVLV